MTRSPVITAMVLSVGGIGFAVGGIEMFLQYGVIFTVGYLVGVIHHAWTNLPITEKKKCDNCQEQTVHHIHGYEYSTEYECVVCGRTELYPA